jgi:hypothetical protein
MQFSWDQHCSKVWRHESRHHKKVHFLASCIPHWVFGFEIKDADLCWINCDTEIDPPQKRLVSSQLAGNTYQTLAAFPLSYLLWNSQFECESQSNPPSSIISWHTSFLHDCGSIAQDFKVIAMPLFIAAICITKPNEGMVQEMKRKYMYVHSLAYHIEYYGFKSNMTMLA